MTIWIQFTRLRPTAHQPTLAKLGDACWDLYADADHILTPGHVHRITTGLAMAIPPGWEGHVRGRSGKTIAGLIVCPGTIDAGYRGEVQVMLHCLTFSTVKAGDRIAQLAIRQVPDVRWEEVAQLDATERGQGGFGSSGR